MKFAILIQNITTQIRARKNKMPLIQGKSQEAFGKNTGKEMDAGKTRAQSLAIAYNMKRRMAQKKAKGGMIQDKEVNRMDEKPEMYAHGGMTNSNSEMDIRKNQIASAFKAKGGMIKKYADGGMVEDEDLDPTYEPEHSAEDTPPGMLGNIASSIMKKRMMAEDGIVNLGHDEEMDQNADFLSDEEQDPFAHHNDFDEFETKPKRRSILDSIMRGR